MGGRRQHGFLERSRQPPVRGRHRRPGDRAGGRDRPLGGGRGSRTPVTRTEPRGAERKCTTGGNPEGPTDETVPPGFGGTRPPEPQATAARDLPRQSRARSPPDSPHIGDIRPGAGPVKPPRLALRVEESDVAVGFSIVSTRDSGTGDELGPVDRVHPPPHSPPPVAGACRVYGHRSHPSVAALPISGSGESRPARTVARNGPGT